MILCSILFGEPEIARHRSEEEDVTRPITRARQLVPTEAIIHDERSGFRPKRGWL